MSEMAVSPHKHMVPVMQLELGVEVPQVSANPRIPAKEQKWYVCYPYY